MADPAFIQGLQVMQTANYVTVAAGALVVYDKVLTFSHEVDHIWNRQWSFTTALYLIARYSGDLQIIGIAAAYVCINWTYSGYVNILLAVNWAQTVFTSAMQAILLMRVYALFNQSKMVLIFLATFYAFQTTATFVMIGILFNKRALRAYVSYVGPAIGSVEQALGYSDVPAYTFLVQDSTILSVIFDAILMFFALWAFVRHALEAKTLNGGWAINVLVRTLVADHLVYFLCNLTWLSLALVVNYGSEGAVSYISLNYALNVFYALVVVAGPRVVISLRVTENETRGEGRTLEGEVSTVRFGAREPPTQPESLVEEGDGFRAPHENVQMH